MKKYIFSTIITLIAMFALPVKSALAEAPSSVSQKAQQQLEKQYQIINPMARTIVKVKPLAKALDQRRCDSPITIIHKPGRANRISAKAVCDHPAWTIFISATVEQWQPVAITSRALSKGTILGDSDVYLKTFDTRRLTSPYFTNPGELIGRELKRSIVANQVISPSQVEKKLLIRKGDVVYIQANKGPMSVRMTGTAQQDGSLGEQIPVINNRSGKKVYGYVKSQGVVSVSHH
ncbi:flagellar basal body P-ring formation chaperone FlgA [Amphritea sp. 1_MG-2023]|uniref:flagellar basal body P-ring formation chaperone FlgA n=1 Tax=Amphritea sp. 1_MG-2023 TaxID=3062670 RepID=UPI0026E377CA|nr:flagellar basal body P-ring formation chaperone FlgA [Amphritea sp. 1_MG-2023]MDO6564528.1 flagellar basal body P-ring formation chaperone FlgA [Amphritea sp. 1_MG-2023]